MARRDFIDKIRDLIQKGQQASPDLVSYKPRTVQDLLVICEQCGCAVSADKTTVHTAWHLDEAAESTEWVVVEAPRELDPSIPPLARPDPPEEAT